VLNKDVSQVQLQAKLAHERSSVAKKRAKGMGILEDLLQSAKAAGGALALGGLRSVNNSAGRNTSSPTVSSSGMLDLTEDEQMAIAMKESLQARAGSSGAVQSQQGFSLGQKKQMVRSAPLGHSATMSHPVIRHSMIVHV
jgi:hypothetical protein